MTNSQKNCFMAVASLRSYTKASRQLHVSQPAVTKQIQMLERDLRLTLFIRDKRTVQLTKNGEELYSMLQRYDLEMNQYMKDARNREESFCGSVRIGLPCGWSIQKLHDAMLGEFEQSHPHMKILAVISTFADLYRLLSENDVDAILTLQPMVPLNQQMNIRNVGSVYHAMAISNTHPLSHLEDLSVESLADEPFYITKDDESAWVYWRNNILSHYGVEPLLYTVENYQTQLAYIRGGKGVALIDMNCGVETKDDFRLIPLDFEEKICLSWKPDNLTGEGELVVDWLLEHFKKTGGLL